MTTYWQTWWRRLGANITVIFGPVLVIVLGRLAAGQKIDINSVVALVAGALATALKQWQSSLDGKAPAKGS